MENVHRKLLTRIIVLLVGLTFMYAATSWADVLPGSAMPEQVAKSLSTSEPEPGGPAPEQIQPPEPPASPLGPEADKIKFQFNGVILEGNQLFSTKQLKPLWEKELHKNISITQLFGIVQNITNFYRNNGYILSRAILPPQSIKSGVVHIQIVEGAIGKVDVRGNPYGARCLVRAYGLQIKRCPPMQLNRMEKYMYLANEIPGTQVKAVLSPSDTQKGAADLTLVTENKPFSSYFSYDNYGTRYIGPQQFTTSVQGNSLIASGDATQFTLTKTPKGHELTYADANYTLPMMDEGTRWMLGGTYTRTNPLFVLQPLQVEGVSNNYYTMIYYPIIRERATTLTARTGFNYLDSNVDELGFELYNDHLRNLDFGFTYNFADRFYGANLISSDLRLGLPILGYTTDTNPETAETSRPGGHAKYAKITLQLGRLQALYGPLSLYGFASGQWAFNALLASEQFAFGGSQLGRGYDVAELIGDKGAAGSLELRYDQGIGKLWVQNLQFYIFYDVGAIWNILSNASTPVKASGASTGGGVRFYFMKNLSGNLMWTQTLTRQVATEELISDGKRPRMFFSVVAILD